MIQGRDAARTVRTRRARPVADAPVEELLAQADELAKGWLLAVIETTSLQGLPGMLGPGLAEDGPRLCAALARGLADDGVLEELGDGGALEPLAAGAAGLVGASGPEAALRAVAALSSVIWSAVRAARPTAGGEEMAQLAERLAAVMDPVREAVLRPPARVAPGAGEPVREAAVPEAEVPIPAPPPEREPAPAPAPPPEREPRTWRPPPEREPRPEPDPPPESEPEPERLEIVPAEVQFEPAVDPGIVLWQRALADEVGAALHSGGALSLLLVELEDAERLRAAGPGAEAARVIGRFTQAIRSIVRRQDILARENETRTWLIARDTARPGAEALARRALDAVAAAAPWRGAPLTAAVGLAVLGEDARDAAGLVEAAEQACFAAAASGNGLVHGDEEA